MKWFIINQDTIYMKPKRDLDSFEQAANKGCLNTKQVFVSDLSLWDV